MVMLVISSSLNAQNGQNKHIPKVSLDVTDADIRNILGVLADISGKNIIIPDNINGKVTTKLDNVPWNQALTIVVSSNNLTIIEDEKTIRIVEAGTQSTARNSNQQIVADNDNDDDDDRSTPQMPSTKATSVPDNKQPGMLPATTSETMIPETRTPVSAEPSLKGVPQPVIKDKVPPQHPVATPPAPRPTQPQPIRPIALSSRDVTTMNFDNIELRDLIRFVSNVMGKNFLFDENIVRGKVTVLSPKNLTKDEAFRVFESVMSYYGFALVPTPEAIKIVRAADARGMALEKFDKKRMGDLPAEDRLVTYVHNLEYLDANASIGVLKPMMAKESHLAAIPSTNSLIMIDTAANIQRIKNILSDIDIPVSRQLGSLKVYNVQHTNSADLAKTVQSLLSQDKKGQTAKERVFVTAYGSTNSLLISAPPEDMLEIERIIREIDTLRPQVLVEAAIVEISTAKGEEFGVEWFGAVKTSSDPTRGVVGGFQRQGEGGILSLGSALLNKFGDSPGSTAAALGALQTGLNIGVIGGDITYNGKQYPGLAAFIHALSSRDGVNILSTPQLLTVNNEEAEIIVGENVPYVTSSRLDTAGNPTYSFEYRDVGVKLKIKPQINKDGFVNLNLYQEVSKVTDATVRQGLFSVPAPTTLKRSTKTTVVVKDSHTVVISGLIKDDSTETQQGIPFLSSLPILGHLFGYKRKVYDKTNLLVFLTPRIVYTSESLEEISKDKRQEQEKLRFGTGKKQ
jgi:general secretion pathway protein D